jgi:hypothetical protein
MPQATKYKDLVVLLILLDEVELRSQRFAMILRHAALLCLLSSLIRLAQC